jgi:hypothetical protein
MNRAWVAGIATAVATAVIGVTIVFLAAGGDDQAQGAASHTSQSTSRTPSTATRRSTTTTTASTTTTTAPTAKLPATGPSVTPTPAVDETATVPEPPDPPDPPDPADRYQPVALPSGATGQVSSCGWSAANGGQLVATGTVTNLEQEDEAWIVNVSWLVTNQGQQEELDYQFQLFDLGPSQTVPWTLTTPSRIAPPNVSCALSIE